MNLNELIAYEYLIAVAILFAIGLILLEPPVRRPLQPDPSAPALPPDTTDPELLRLQSRTLKAIVVILFFLSAAIVTAGLAAGIASK